MAFLEDFYLDDHISDVAKKIFSGDLEFTRGLHPGLARALYSLSERYLGHMSQSELAQLSCISASHLAFLFRSQLRMRFKALLVELRLLYAISLLRENPKILITDLCLQSGFGDLSHFEKMFRRYTSLSVREARRYIRGKGLPGYDEAADRVIKNQPLAV